MSRVKSGLESTAALINASPKEIIFGSSSSILVENLARSLNGDIKSTDEFIITDEHESRCCARARATLSNDVFSANAGPWKKLAKQRGLLIHTWAHTPLPNAPPDNPYALGLNISSLIPLINSNTRLVAFTACSNILGSIVDVEAVVKAIREEAKAKGNQKLEVCVDCVAYAPHRRLDVRKWDVDYAFFSYYKVLAGLLSCPKLIIQLYRSTRYTQQ
jgi:selenocysteine lyase/cysteine desulfurase